MSLVFGWRRCPLTQVVAVFAGVFIAITVVARGGAAHAFEWPFVDEVQRGVEKAQRARESGDFDAALRYLQGAEEKATDEHAKGRAGIAWERGLLYRAQGRLEFALQALQKGADDDPHSGARVDQAGVLVELGRWPEAISTLRQAFDERGMTLAVAEISGDPRFAKLTALEPYAALLAQARSAREGPFGDILRRLEDVQGSAASTDASLRRLANWIEVLHRLAGDLRIAAIVLIFMGLLVTFGIAQMRLLPPPWTLIVGMLIASASWHIAARVGTAGQSDGLSAIRLACGVVAGLWASVAALRAVVRQRRRSVLGPTDAFAPMHRDATLAIMAEVSELARHLDDAPAQERRSSVQALRKASSALHKRLSPR